MTDTTGGVVEKSPDLNKQEQKRNGLWKEYCHFLSILEETPKGCVLYEMALQRKNQAAEELIKKIRAQPPRKTIEQETWQEYFVIDWQEEDADYSAISCRINSLAEIAFSEKGKVWMCDALGEDYCEHYGGCRYSEPCGGCTKTPIDI